MSKKKHAPIPKVNAKGDLTAEVEKLFNDGVLVDLQIGMWTALQRNTKEDLGIEESVPDYVVGLGMKRLIPKELAKTWVQIAGHARYVLRMNSFQFPISETSFVPIKALPHVIEQLEKCQAKFDHAWRTGLLDNFDKVREEFLSEYPKHRKRLEKLFPRREALEGKFYFEYGAFTVQLPKRIKMRKEEEESKAMEKYRRELDRRVEEFLSETVKTLRAKAVDICTSIVDSVRSGKTISTTSLSRLSKYIEQFKTMNFVGDSEIENRLTKLQHDILNGRDAEEFKDDAVARKALAAACDDIRKAAESVSDLSSVTGGYRRRIVLD